MRAYELVATMRSRLRDEAKEGWSDDELLENINMALSAMAHKLMPWKGRYTHVTTIGIDTYSLPDDVLSPISLVLNDELIPVVGIEWALSSDDGTKKAAYIDNDALIIAPMPASVMTFSLNYHAMHRCSGIGDVLNLNDGQLDTALYYALSLCYQKQSSEESLAQSKYYLQLFKDRCSDIAHLTAKRRSGIVTTSRFQRV